MRITPFNEGDTFSTFRSIKEKAIHDIESLENEYILNVSPDKLEKYYIEQVTLVPLHLDSEKYYIDNHKGIQLDVSNDFRRAALSGERIITKGTKVDIAIPFTGNPILWRIRSSSFSFSGYPEIEVRDDVIVFSKSFPDDSPDPEKLRVDIERTISSFSKSVSSLAVDVENHNREATRAIRNTLERKLSKSKNAIGAISALGIPIKPRTTPATYVIPTKIRKSPITRPSATLEKCILEPTLEQGAFEHILGVMKSMSLVIERSPQSFASLDEEAIRTLFLVLLNGHYEGLATGETFNASGKTDILIRVENKNIFIAECKFWHGAKYFSEAIDQLLGYLSWKDSKCALIIFNKTKNSTSVRKKMHEIMMTRPEYKKLVIHDQDDDSRYIFVKPSDLEREIQIHTMLFDMPEE